MPLLAIAVPGPVEIEGKLIRMPAKTASGLEEFARAWPGEVVHVTEFQPMQPNPSMGLRTVSTEGAPYSTVATQDRIAALERLRPDVLLANLSRSELPLLESGVAPVAVVTENDLRNRLRWVWLEERRPGPSLARAFLGLIKLEKRYRKVLARAAGIQANGPTARSTYGGLAPTVTYYDARIPGSKVVAENAEKHPNRPFTFAFSGRWLAQKGVMEALEAFARADFRREVRLQVIGSGPLSDAVANFAALDPRIEVLGSLDFDTEWIPHVRDQVDLMLLPHLQGDPAGTFLEGVGCGAPFLAFATRHSQHLADHGIGWTVPMQDIRRLAELLEETSEDPGMVGRARTAGARFMQDHSQEREFERRVEHLLSISRGRR